MPSDRNAQTTVPPASGATPSAGAWRVVVLLVPVALLNYMDRQMLAAMKFSVMADIPDIQLEANWGKILALFKWTYALMSPIGGYLADRFSRRHVIVFSLAAWSAITWATGQVQTYGELMATRAIMGISEAFYIPAALALIADYHAGPTRSRAVGLHQLGIYLGVIIGGFSGYAADHPSLGWRWLFDVCGVLGVVYAAPLFWALRNAPPRADVAAASGAPPGRALRELFGNLGFILLVLYFTLPAMAAWIVRDWMPAVLKAEFGIGQGKAGVSATLYWMVACIFGALAGGWLADRWSRRDVRGRIYTSAIGTVCVAVAMFGVGYSPQTGRLWVAVSFLVLFGWGWGFFDANNMPILCQVTRPHLRATGYGLMNMVSISCGGLADWFFGILRDQRVPLLAIFGIFSVVALLSVSLVLLIQPRQRDDPPAMTGP
ncbi:MFS transporter [Fontisphaera persica]|uniref:MFS transporter n=1 Tax=Fontisphaera persica TaxID=2974023 RepID=UPI0024BFA06D|nr:MFS transporter [Fontisphaera persica]WCJ61144.1 MFS transporter [Fontisphaera persica]